MRRGRVEQWKGILESGVDLKIIAERKVKEKEKDLVGYRLDSKTVKVPNLPYIIFYSITQYPEHKNRNGGLYNLSRVEILLLGNERITMRCK